MTAFLSRLLRFLVLVWLLFAASPLPALTLSYDAQTRHVSTDYDEAPLVATGCALALTLLTNDNEHRSVEADGSYSHFADFLAAKGAAGEASSALQAARLKEHLRQLEKYGQAGFKELESGRIRYYGNIDPATTPGTMAGRRLVREWDPSTGAARTWHETVDQAGRVRIVRPETGGSKVHYMFGEHGNYTGSF